VSFLLTCPNCGPRDVNEFAYRGEVTTRPQERPTLRELTDYVYVRRNVAGVQREWWYHRQGCGQWFLADRDTRTNAVSAVSVPALSVPESAKRERVRAHRQSRERLDYSKSESVREPPGEIA